MTLTLLKSALLTISLTAALSFSPRCLAGPMTGAGNNFNEAGVFTITGFDPPFVVTNPPGPGESRAAVEFDLSALENGQFLNGRLLIRGIIESNKTLEIHGYTGNGTVTAADLTGGTFVDAKDLTTTPGISEIEVDITKFLNDDFLLSDGTVPSFLGFNLRESESEGGVVTLEYLVLMTFLANGANDPVDIERRQPAGPAVPEPASILIWLIVGTGIAFAIRLKSRRGVAGALN